MPKQIFYIYELIDPRTGETRYIGQTRNPTSRLANHISDALPDPKRAWIAELLDGGLRPEMRVLYETSSPLVDERAEIRKAIAEGASLLNKELNHQSPGKKINLKGGERQTIIRRNLSEDVSEARRRNAIEVMLPAALVAHAKLAEERSARRIRTILESDLAAVAARDIADMVGCTIPTAKKCLQRLAADYGWGLKKTRRGKRGPKALTAIRPD